jgi:glutathione peroxidase-family protein
MSAAIPSLTRLDGSALPSSELDGKVVLFVNVASRCGHTPQYDGLQALYAEKHDAGFEIVGVPCNQFGGQEPGAPEEIATFCRVNYGVTFPLLDKQDVNGAGRSPLYAWLVGSAAGGGQDVAWNFEKFLVGRDGRVIARFGSRTRPDDAALRAAIESAL